MPNGNLTGRKPSGRPVLRKYYTGVKFRINLGKVKISGIFPKTLQNFFTYLIDRQGISWYNVIVPRGNRAKGRKTLKPEGKKKDEVARRSFEAD